MTLDFLAKGVALIVGLLLVCFLILGEVESRINTASLTKDMKDFMNAGDRFPASYGIGNCEDIKALQAINGLPENDCDALRRELIRVPHAVKAK